MLRLEGRKVSWVHSLSAKLLGGRWTVARLDYSLPVSNKWLTTGNKIEQNRYCILLFEAHMTGAWGSLHAIQWIYKMKFYIHCNYNIKKFVFPSSGRSKTIFFITGSNCFQRELCLYVGCNKKMVGFLPSFITEDFHRNLDPLAFPEEREMCKLSILSEAYNFPMSLILDKVLFCLRVIS